MPYAWTGGNGKSRVKSRRLGYGSWAGWNGVSRVESRMLGVLCVVRRLPGTVGCRALCHGMVRELEGVGFSRGGI